MYIYCSAITAPVFVASICESIHCIHVSLGNKQAINMHDGNFPMDQLQMWLLFDVDWNIKKLCDFIDLK